MDPHDAETIYHLRDEVRTLRDAVGMIRELAQNLRTASSGREFVHADTVSDNILSVLDSTT